MKLRNPGRWLLASVVALLVLLALMPGARPVDLAEVGHGSVVESFEAEGRTRVRDRYLLTAPIAAMARRLALQPGDRVEAGQVLVVLDPVLPPSLDRRSREEAQARVEAARARLRAAGEEARAAQSLAEQAGSDDARVQSLRERGLVALEAAEQARTARLRAEREAASARFREATARHELEAAEAVLAQGEGSASADASLALRAPVPGQVLRRYYESARPVQPGDPLLEIGEPAALEVEVEVLSQDAVRLAPGLRVELHRWGGPLPLPARVRRIEPGGFTRVSALGVEEQRVWVIVDLDPAGDGQPDAPPSPEFGVQATRLGDAFRVHARFELARSDSTLRVPASAVFRHQGGEAVFVQAGGRAELRPIRAGLRGGGFVEVVDGLAAGERVVLHPPRELGAGDRIRARAEAGAAL